MSASLARKQPWVALAVASFPLHWAWEMLQAPLYASMRALSRGTATWRCTVAAGGDVVITFVAYAVVAWVVGNRDWLLRVLPGRIAGYLAVGLVITVAVEEFNVQHLGRWSYASSMPRVLGVGLSPLMQWIVVPLLTIWIVNRDRARDAMLNTT